MSLPDEVREELMIWAQGLILAVENDDTESVRRCLTSLLSDAELYLWFADGSPGDRPKDTAAVLMGARGGLKGGPARAAKLTPKQRSDAACFAARARWGRRPTPPDAP